VRITTELQIETGDILYEEGDANHWIYVFQSGEVTMFRNSKQGRIDVDRRGPASILGALSIITGEVRFVTAQAVTHCRLFRISGEQVACRYEKLDLILRACLEKSINFSRALGDRKAGDHVPQLLPNTLLNSSEWVARFRLAAELLEAIGSDEFSTHYQPIVCMIDGRIIGAEALMRWTSPALGVVRPDIFIAAAEAAGVMQHLTKVAITQACITLRGLQDAGTVDADFYLTVNISAQDIGREGFVDYLAHSIDRFELRPACLKLELTETAFIQDTECADINLHRIRDLGCRVSVDDFGTVYSNLAYLKSVPMTAIKIDRSFAGHARTCAMSRAIVKMLVAFGCDLGFNTIAEELETRDDVETLTDLGCNVAHGVHFQRPMTEPDLILCEGLAHTYSVA
jgi:EAL domain-containing protein (putative c-di-GMP-specific phosphodiesterase class I)